MSIIVSFFFIGYAKIIDKYLLDTWATYHDTVVRDKNIFLIPMQKIQIG